MQSATIPILDERQKETVIKYLKPSNEEIKKIYEEEGEI
jgi:hypothetical protein